MLGTRRGALLLILALLTACSSPIQSQNGFLPPAPSVQGATGSLVLRVTVPDERHAHFVSPSTARISVKITGATKYKKSAALAVGASGCRSKLMTLVCTLNIPALKACPTKKACYTGSVSTYDASAHLLSRDQNFKFSIGTKPTIIPLVLYGVPASVAVMPDTGSNLTGSQATGFVEPKCSASAQTMSLLGVDVDGNYIVGVGSPALSLTSGDTSQLTIANGSTAGTFVLSPPAAPAYPHGNHTIQLTATATPPKQSGGAAASAKFNVTYSGDICGTFAEYPLPTASAVPFGIAVGPDGNLWVPEAGGSKIARVTMAGTIAEFPVTAASEPLYITTGPDGNLWFSEDAGSKIGKMSTSGTLLAEYPTLSPNAQPLGIALGPDGNLWFVENGVNKVGAVTAGGAMLPEINIPTATALPFQMVAGPDGALWFTEFGANKIGRVTTSGSISDFAPASAGSEPYNLTSAFGSIWFGEVNNDKVGRMTTNGTTTSEVGLPEPVSGPFGVTGGPDGAIWFTEFAGNRIGREDLVTGNVTEFSIPTGASEPTGMTLGPDGGVWFLEGAGNKVGELR